MTSEPTQSGVPILDRTIKATSSLTSAFADPFNLFMVGTFGFLAVVSIVSLVRRGFAVTMFVSLIIASLFLFVYIRAILNRGIEISNEGVRYREASIRHFFKWEAIEAIRVERNKKQITFWMNGKRIRIHEFGLPAQDLDLVREALARQIATRKITMR